MNCNDDFFLKKGLCGITNTGNTCFINTILQCINANRDLAVILFNDKYKLNQKSIAKHIVEQWIILSKILWTKNCVVTPTSFINTLLQVQKKKNINMTIGNQQDSQEFLQFFLELFHEGLSSEVKITIQGEPKNSTDKKAVVAYTRWKNFFENQFSPIIKMYFGQYYNIVSKNDENSETYDPFSCVSLEILNQNCNLYSCLDRFTSVETIQTGEKSYLKKQILFWSLPQHLIIFLKRYSYDNCEKKKNYMVDFPLNNLDLSKYYRGYRKNKQIFQLYAVSNHIGNCFGGHYYAYVKNLDGNWYKYDDNIVTQLPKNKVVTENAYCLFYRKND